MAANEPNKPDNVINIAPGNKTQAEEKTAPDQPLQAGGEAPAPEVMGAEMKKPTEPDKTAPPPAPEEKAPEPAKQARRGRPPKAEKADKPEKEPKPEKAAKTEKSARPKKAPAKEETPAPEPEQPAEPREAPRPNGKDEIVYLNISELRAFKDHPFGVRDDAEMRALVESVKDKGVNELREANYILKKAMGFLVGR